MVKYSIGILSLRYFNVLKNNSAYILLGVLLIIYLVFVFIINENIMKQRYNLSYKTMKYDPPEVIGSNNVDNNNNNNDEQCPV